MGNKLASVCVYSSSSNALDKLYLDAADKLGGLLAQEGIALVYGAGGLGLMGRCARAVHNSGGRVIGVIPESLKVEGVFYPRCDEFFVTKTMRQRKELMEDKSEAFIALPGGFGTLEEVLEIITLKQLRYHEKPIVLLNINGFYDMLIAQFDEIIGQRFAKEASRTLYFVAHSPEQALEYIKNYQPVRIEEKWFT